MYTIVFYVTEETALMMRENNQNPLSNILPERDVIPMDDERSVFAVVVDDEQLATQIVTRLQASTYVKAAYIKPQDAAP